MAGVAMLQWTVGYLGPEHRGRPMVFKATGLRSITQEMALEQNVKPWAHSNLLRNHPEP